MKISVTTNNDYNELCPLKQSDVKPYSNNKINKLFSSLVSISSKDLQNDGMYKDLIISSIRRKTFSCEDDQLVLKFYKKIYDGIEQYHVQTGLYAGVIYYPFDKDVAEFHIVPKFGKILLNRMLNMSNHIYVDAGSLQSTDSKQDEDYFAYIVEYLFLHAFEKARLAGFPRQYKKIQMQTTKYRGSLNVPKHIRNDLPFLGKMSVTYREQQIPKEIVNVLYCALKNFSKSAYNTQKVKKYEQELKPLATCKSVTNSDIKNAQKCSAIQNPLFAQYKKVLKYAEIILKRNGLRFDSESSNSEIRGFLVDVSELWEVYLEKILQDNFPDWNINGQYEMPFYKESTFFGRDFYPDLLLEKDNQYAVFDAKFKDMNGTRSDVDRNDLHQIHMYAGHFAKMGNLVAAGLLYPCSKLPNERWNAELNTYTSKPAKFVIDGVNVEKIQKDSLSYEEAFEILEEDERLFVERIRTYIESGKVN